MPHFWYLVQNNVIPKNELAHLYINDNANYNEEKHSLSVTQAYVIETKLIFNDVVL